MTTETARPFVLSSEYQHHHPAKGEKIFPTTTHRKKSANGYGSFAQKKSGIFLGIPYDDIFEFVDEFDPSVLRKRGYGGNSETARRFKEALINTVNSMKKTLDCSSRACVANNSILEFNGSRYLICLARTPC